MKRQLSTILAGIQSALRGSPSGNFGRIAVGACALVLVCLQQFSSGQQSGASPSTVVANYPDDNPQPVSGSPPQGSYAFQKPVDVVQSQSPVHVYPPGVVDTTPVDHRRRPTGSIPIASGHALGGHAFSGLAAAAQPEDSIHVYPPGIVITNPVKSDFVDRRAAQRSSNTTSASGHALSGLAAATRPQDPIHVYPPGIEVAPSPGSVGSEPATSDRSPSWQAGRNPNDNLPPNTTSLRAVSMPQAANSGHAGYPFTVPPMNDSTYVSAPNGHAHPSGSLFSPEVFEAPDMTLPGHMGLSTPASPHQHISGPSQPHAQQLDVSLAWWERDIPTPILRGRQPIFMTLEMAIGVALSEAPELQILHSDWFIQQIEITRQDAAFDWTTFVEGVWNRDSNPVSSDLDGAANRLRSRTGSVNAGGRRLFRDGGEFEISQNLGLRSSNSQFISPNNQGNSRLQFEWQHPLLRGGGEEYNTSPVIMAAIEKDSAFDRFQIGVQDHLLEVASAYWVLVLRRGRFVQAVASWNRSQEIEREMAGRVNVDVTPSMLERTRSEVASRLATSIEADHDTIRAQDALLRLIYGSRFVEFANNEIVTQTLPMKQGGSVDPEPQIQQALRNRSEVHRAIRDIKMASVRYKVAENEILPVLDMTLSGYVAGLRGGNDVGSAFLQQFSEGEPGIGIGFNYEIPYRNRAAEAAAEQGQIAIKRMQAALQASIADVTEDVRAQVIQRNKFAAVLPSQWQSLDGARKLLTYTQARREGLVDGTRVADLYLENLLQNQSRLEAAEFAFLQSQIRYAVADNSLLRSISSIDSLAADTGSPRGPAAAVRQASASRWETSANEFSQFEHASMNAEMVAPPKAPFVR